MLGTLGAGGGPREGTKSTEYMRDNRDLDVWFVPMAGRVMVPSKISVKTMRGMLLVVATQFGENAKLGKVEQAANDAVVCAGGRDRLASGLVVLTV